MYANRILRLARRLVVVENKHFNISNWYDSKGKQIKEKSADNCVLDEGFCGSTACVLGTACLIKDFNKLGLFIHIHSYSGLGHVIYKKGGHIYDNEKAGAKFFGLPKSHASFLFFVDDQFSTYKFYKKDESITSEDFMSYDAPAITPQEVAVRLIEYVETKGKNLTDWVKKDKLYTGHIKV